jgi:hypothetical protein
MYLSWLADERIRSLIGTGSLLCANSRDRDPSLVASQRCLQFELRVSLLRVEDVELDDIFRSGSGQHIGLRSTGQRDSGPVLRERSSRGDSDSLLQSRHILIVEGPDLDRRIRRPRCEYSRGSTGHSYAVDRASNDPKAFGCTRIVPVDEIFAPYSSGSCPRSR